MRHVHAAVAVAVVGVLTFGLVATPASGAATAHPQAGSWSGQAAYPTPQPVTFTVNHKATKVTNFSSTADVKTGCTAPNPSFQTPITPAKISKSGHFVSIDGAYYDSLGKPYHVTVTVKGHFTSKTKVAGTFTLVSKKYKHCNLSAKWTATRT